MKHFTISELCHSATAKARGLDNTPTPEVVANLTRLVDNVLDPLRSAYGKPITVTSGYRSAQVNRSVNGATSSQHLKGEAADITAGSKAENKRLFELIQSLGLPWDQLINENDYSWVHVSHKASGNRKQILKL